MYIKKRHAFSVLLTLGLIQLMVFQNCSQIRSKVSSSAVTSPSDNILGTQGGPSPTPSGTPSLKDVTQNFEVTQNKAVDVLVVIDNSGSMAYEQSNMAQRFNTFIDALQGLDWHLAIITTDVDADAPLKDGRFIRFGGNINNEVMDSTMNLADVKAAFASTVQRPQNEGSSDEQGIRATYRNLERYTDMNSVNDSIRRFYRANASFSVLVVTDANETPRNNVVQVSNTPDGLIQKVTDVFNKKVFRYNSIIVKPNDSACLHANANESYGTSYADLSNKTKGEIGSVCEADYGSQLHTIGQATVDAVNNVKLSCNAVVGSVEIRSDAGAVVDPALYSLVGNEINFPTSLNVGKYIISYKCP